MVCYRFILPLCLPRMDNGLGRALIFIEDYMKYFLLLLSLSACTTAQEVVTQPTNLYYQKDIKFEVNEQKFTGSAIVNMEEKWRIKVYPEGKADLISVTSCHRELRTEKPDKKMFEKGYTFEIKPSELEGSLSCPIEIAVFELNKGRNAWGTIVIKTDKAKLAAELWCNGEKFNVGGVSYCQSRKGLIQQIKFDREVIVVSIPECGIGATEGKNFQFLLPQGPCTVYFLDKADKQVIHQANLYGYDEILLKE